MIVRFTPTNTEWQTPSSLRGETWRVDAAKKFQYDGPEKKKRFDELAPEGPAEDSMLFKNFGHFQISSIPEEYYKEDSPYYRWITGKVDWGKVFELHSLLARLVVAQRNVTFARSVFKEPNHLIRLPWILDTYPNAKFIWCHRDLEMALKSAAEDSIVADRVVEGASKVLELIIRLRDAIDKQDGITNGIAGLRPKDDIIYFDPDIPRAFKDDVLVNARTTEKNCEKNSRFFDVSMNDLLTDPVNMMQNIYAYFDLGDLDPTFETRIRDFHATNTRKPRTDYTTPFHWLDIMKAFYQYILYFPSTISVPVDTILPIHEPPPGFFLFSENSSSSLSGDDPL